ncbi:MAG: 2Fe-2S iron-sulfur cluster-binding protein [Hyphomicrobiaceae bacterium]
MRHQDLWTDAVVVSVTDVASSVREIRFRPDVMLPSYAPGSHLDVTVLVGARTDHRSYSLVGAPEGDTLKIAVKAQPNSRGGSRYMWSLAAGSRIRVSAPVCAFELLPGSPDYLLLAGGIGITPLVGMAEALVRQGSNFRLLYAAQSEADIAYRDLLVSELGKRVEFFPSDRSRMDLKPEIGKLHRQGELYVCGPMRMLDAARRLWEEAGRTPSKLRYETFGSSGHFASHPFVVNIPRLGVTVNVPESQSILDALTEAGVSVLSDCERGECGVCVLDVIETQGTIDHRDVFFSAQQQALNNKICACVSRVAGRSITVEPPFREDCSPGPDIYASAE